MRIKIRYLTISFLSLFVGLITFCPLAKAADRPTISAAERALAMLEVQNTFSKHAYYHTIHAHCEEMEDIWVRKDGEWADTAKWTNPQGIQDGIALIYENYCVDNLEDMKKNLEAISKLYPDKVKNVPENIGTGDRYTVHMQTTPIIEIAGDGKTAKGVWYSPGIMLRAQIVGDKVYERGSWFMEKYAVDFAKEDGKWKIWHFQMFYDPTPPAWGDEVVQPQPIMAEGQAEGQAPVATGGLKTSRPNPDPYTGWSPTWIPGFPELTPRLPEPYYTFSETFSY